MPQTSLTTMLGSTVPVVGAPMSGTAGPALAAAVTAGGGTGMLGVAPGTPPDDVRRALADAGTGCGAGVLAWALEAEGDGGAAVLDALVEAAPALVSIAYGPWRAPVARVRAAGVPVATVAGTLEAAREAADAGVDVLVVRGGEAGGHGRDAVATLPLLQQVLDEVDHPCVVAAGGIGTARGLAAVLAAGAAGAWLGTALLASPEAANTEARRAAIVAAAGTDTVHSRVHDVVTGGWPREFGGRSLRDEHTDRWAGREDEIDAESLAAMRAAGVRGAYAGQGAGLVTRSRSATEIVAGIGSGAEALLSRF